jgi:hypothetical protein
MPLLGKKDSPQRTLSCLLEDIKDITTKELVSLDHMIVNPNSFFSLHVGFHSPGLDIHVVLLHYVDQMLHA